MRSARAQNRNRNDTTQKFWLQEVIELVTKKKERRKNETKPENTLNVLWVRELES